MSLADRIASNVNWSVRRPSARGPYRAVVEISNACNLKCAMCPRNHMTRPVRFMALDFFESLIARNADSLEFVSLNGYGEPLLHRDLVEMVGVCKRHNVGVGISTNCTQLDQDKTRQLLDSGLDLIILAVDGVSAESYEKVRVGASFDTVMGNVRHFLAERRRQNRGPYTILQCIAMDETREAMQSFRRTFSDPRPDAFRLRQLAFTGDRQSDPAFINDRRCCYWPWAEPMVLSDGRVAACCQDVNGALIVGDAAKATLAEIWSDAAIRRLRETHASGHRADIPVCAACNMVQPSRMQALGSMCFDTRRLNRILPFAESLIASLRYR